MKTTKLACWLSCLLVLSPGVADDTDVIAAGWVAPNVLIVLDSSGSMNDSVGGTPKITIAKQVVTNLISSTTNVRFGVMKFRANGAAMVAPIGTPTPTIVTAVNSASTTSVGTPLGDALKEAGDYFKGSFPGHPSPIDVACRLNMIIVVSDGLQNSSTVDIQDEALLRFTEDHSSGLADTQNVMVNTVGFAIDPSSALAANSILQTAATNGGGTFYSTDGGPTLQAALEDAIQTIVAGTFSFAGMLIPSTQLTGSDKAYQASFLSDPVRPAWQGFLDAYQRDASGNVPTDAAGVPLVSARVWEAGQKLKAKAASARTIYTSLAGTRHVFARSNGAISTGVLGVATAAARDDVIDFIRGVDSFDEDGDGDDTEQRTWKLGALMHSAPVLVTPPLYGPADPAYDTFRLAQAGRPTVLLVGANDGMLHAFRDSDGEELWGYIPPDLLDKLVELTPNSGTAPYFVDSSPVVADVKIAGAYRTVVLFGERRGGSQYHALDVTDPTDPLPLWSFTDAKIRESWSVPVIARVLLDGPVVKDVAIFGGGYDTPNNNNSGKAIFVVDMADGTKLWEYYNDSTTDDRQYLNYSIASAPTVVDLNGDGFADRVYVGDVGGQMWKLDLSADATASWTGKRLFAAVPAQPNPPPAGTWLPQQAIYGAPEAALDEAGGLWLYFGTGDLNNPANPSQNRFYGLKETTDMTNGGALTEASLVDVTSTDITGPNGWYIRLDADEKVLSSANAFDGNVFFTTFTPTAIPTCGGGSGPAEIYAVQMITGYAAIDWAVGEALATSSSSEPRSTSAGTGIPGTPAVVATEDDGALEASVVTGTSDEQIDDQGIPPVALRRILYWREVF